MTSFSYGHSYGEDRSDPNANLANDAGNACRPADVYVARWRNGLLATIDIAVTSGQHQEVVRHATTDGLHACRMYEDFKRIHNGTEAQCLTDGITFIPLCA